MEHYSTRLLMALVKYEDRSTILDLSGKRLSRVPDSVVHLIEVMELNLVGNYVTELPTFMNRLKHLVKLYLSENRLTELPAEIGDLKELRELCVSDNQLVGLPASMQQLDKLEMLDLRNNKLTELPAEIGDLTELRGLNVSDNQLVGLPASMLRLDKLEQLDLGNNKLTELPAGFGDLKELRELYVSSNQLAGLPASMQKLHKLEDLGLQNNKLAELPVEIGDLKELRQLIMSDNHLVGLPASTQKLHKLEVLDLSHNKLTELPAGIGDLKELSLLDVSDNQLVGLPASMQELDKLEQLDLRNNKLTELPAGIGDLKQLRRLNVSNNHLVGLPVSMLKLDKLKEMDLRNNKLTELPAEIGDLKELRLLNVSGNPLNLDAIRCALKLKKSGKVFVDYGFEVPREIEARGEKAQHAYQSALRDGVVNVYRSRVLLIGQDRAGKTSLKKSLIGLSFNPKENSTKGIEVDPSIFQVDVDEVKNWQAINKCKQGLLGCSKDVAQMVVEKMAFLETRRTRRWQFDPENVFNKNGEQVGESDLENDLNKNGEQVGDSDREKKGESFVNQLAGPDYELVIHTTSPPDEIKEHAVKLIKHLKGKGKGVEEESAVCIELWDFAGQHLYYASHPVFLTPRALYVLVYNLSKSLHDIAQPFVRQRGRNVELNNPNGETNLENLLSWLSTLHCIAQMRGDTCDDAEGKLPHLRPPVIIVGTHADKAFEDIETMKSEIQRGIAGKDYGAHVVPPIFSIDNTETLLQRKIKKVLGRGRAGQDENIDKIQALRDKIKEVLGQDPYMGESIPARWLIFEMVISALLSKKVYQLSVEKLRTHAKNECFVSDEEEFTTMVNFYHDLGIIIKHRSTVILSAKWLIDLVMQLITIPEFKKMGPKVSKHWKEVEESGVLSMELVDHVFSKFLLEGVARIEILDLMEKFGLIAKFSPSEGNEKYFVPCQLKMSPDSLCAIVPSSSDPCPLYVNFISGFVPHGLFTLLVSRLVRWCSEAGPPQPPTLYQNGAWFVIGKQIIHDLVFICKKQFIKFFVRQKIQRQQILEDDTSEVAVQVREFVESTLQDLSHDFLYLRGLRYQIGVSCPYCKLEECSVHNQMACSRGDCLHLLQLRQGEPLICKKKPSLEILTVTGQQKWFSQRAKENLYPLSSSDTVESRPQRLMLKVALLANEWGSSKGGLSTINRTLAINFAKHTNVNVTILVPEFGCSEEDKRTAESHNIAIREAKRRPGYSDPLDWLISPPKDLDIQVVIGHGAKLGRQAQLIRVSHCCKWVQVVHTEPEELAMHKNYPSAIAKGEEKNRAEVELCQLADLVVAVGPKLAEAFSSYLRSSHQDIFQVIPGTFAEFSDVKHTTQESAKFKVLTFGRGDFEDFSLKGYDIAAKAIVELKDSSYRLIFVGAPEGKQDEVAETLLQTGISRNQLTVRSFVKNKQRLKEMFCEVDVVIMPSRTEGFGLTALEAMSAGLPILVSGNSGFGEALRGLPMGDRFVIDSDDPKKWAKAIEDINHKSRALRFEEIQILRRRYNERFRWERQCQSLVDRMWKMVYGNEKPQEREMPVNSCQEDAVTHQKTGETIFLALQRIMLETCRETSKSEWSLNLKTIALEKGFEISENQGEGNCMFLAISEQLNLVKGIQISHDELRQSVVQYLRDNPRLPDGTDLFQFVDRYSSWDAYVTNMMKDGTWGDHVILHGAANCFQVCIHVISSLQRHHDVMICPEYDVAGGNRLVLGHVHELHYVSLVSHKGCKDV